MTLRAVRTHYFHANATAIGGYIERPFKKDIPVQSPTTLAPAGGSDEACTTDFQFEKIINAKMTRSRVEGHYAGTLPTTRATATVEGLNVLDMIRADELVAYISSEHPGEDPEVPKIDFGHTAINGLRVGDSFLTVHLDTTLLDLGNGKRFPKKPHLYEKALWKKADQKFEPDKGFLQCTLVQQIEVTRGKRPNIVGPNIIEIPDIGRLHLAELLVSGNAYELIMLRLELGCPTVGASSNAAAKVNGGGSGP
jgi:hypothetical protein